MINGEKSSYLCSFRTSRSVVYSGTYLRERTFRLVHESHRVCMEALSSEVQHRLETNPVSLHMVCGHLSSRSECVGEELLPTS